MALSMHFMTIVVLLHLTNAMPAEVSFARNLADFSVDLYVRSASENPEKNIIISPLSVQTAIGLTYMGATGKTAEEMANGLRLGTNSRSSAALNFGKLMDSYGNHPSVNIANKVYVKTGYNIKSEFNEIATRQFRSEAEHVEFSNGQRAADIMNKWVEDKTNEKIKDLISPDMLDDSTRMVLLNAIYFHGKWEKQFPNEATNHEDFWVTKHESVKVDMMQIEEQFKYGGLPNLDARAVELHYDGKDLSMLILLPNQVSGLRSLEKKLQSVNLLDEFRSLRVRNVNLKLPKFKVEFSTSLKEVLSQMNMKKMFSPEAEFGNLLEGDNELYISEVVHKAFIEVDETGTEAAGATGVITNDMAAWDPVEAPEEFFVDHPFIYFIKDRTGNILFMGSYRK